MIEIRTFAEGPAELSALYLDVWKKRYLGKMPIILWDAPFMQWELFQGPPESRDFLVAAYDKSRLVGILPARPEQYHLRARPVAGTISSYLSVDPDYETQGVSLKLFLEQRKRHRERGRPLFLGYLILGTAVALGKEFWLRMPTVHSIGKVGFWARMIDHRAIGDFLFPGFDQRATRALGWIQRPPKQPRNVEGFRPYRAGDLEDCLRLASHQSESAEFGIIWDRDSLARQLAGGGYPRTIVAEQNGRVAGFVNYFTTTFCGRRELRGAIIDFLSLDELPAHRRKDLLLSAMQQMIGEGCQLVLLMRVSGQPQKTLWSTGFVPQPPESEYISQSMLPDAPVFQTKSLHVTWR